MKKIMFSECSQDFEKTESSASVDRNCKKCE